MKRRRLNSLSAIIRCALAMGTLLLPSETGATRFRFKNERGEDTTLYAKVVSMGVGTSCSDQNFKVDKNNKIVRNAVNEGDSVDFGANCSVVFINTADGESLTGQLPPNTPTSPLPDQEVVIPAKPKPAPKSTSPMPAKPIPPVPTEPMRSATEAPTKK